MTPFTWLVLHDVLKGWSTISGWKHITCVVPLSRLKTFEGGTEPTPSPCPVQDGNTGGQKCCPHCCDWCRGYGQLSPLPPSHPQERAAPLALWEPALPNSTVARHWGKFQLFLVAIHLIFPIFLNPSSSPAPGDFRALTEKPGPRSLRVVVSPRQLELGEPAKPPLPQFLERACAQGKSC